MALAVPSAIMASSAETSTWGFLAAYFFFQPGYNSASFLPFFAFEQCSMTSLGTDFLFVLTQMTLPNSSADGQFVAPASTRMDCGVPATVHGRLVPSQPRFSLRLNRTGVLLAFTPASGTETTSPLAKLV